jgi:hypothetical protein
MKQINTYALYDLASRMAALRSLPDDPKLLEKIKHAFPLIVANYHLGEFFTTNRVLPLEISEDAAHKLNRAIEVVADKLWREPPTEEVTPYEIQTIKSRLDELETVMSLELQRHHTYIVSQIGGYSMPLLVTKAEVNILEDALAVIGDHAKKDFREAGRCLAFEVPTAAGFHAMRATEHVLRQYYALVMKKPTDRIDWGTCTNELKKANADSKIVQVLDQIRDLHRNPLMHPQEFLSMKDAIGLFDIAKSAISSLAEEISMMEAAATAEAAAAEAENAWLAAAEAATAFGALGPPAEVGDAHTLVESEGPVA